MEKLQLREIAENNGLRYIETTSEINGYPSNIKAAIIGFDTFEQAEEIAEKTKLSIELFAKRDGWELWHRTGNAVYEAMRNSSEDYGGNYSHIEKMTEQEFITSEILQMLEGLEKTDNCTFDFLENLICEKKKLFEEVENMEEDEIVITCQGDYYETIKKESMYWSHDTKHFAIGLIDRNEY